MSTTTGSSKPNAGGETVVEHVTRSTKNGFFSCFGFTKKSGDLAKIKYKETLISNRKKTFGMEYFALLNNDGTEEELKACVTTAQEDIKKIEEEIKELESKIAAVDEETNKKIVSAPASSTTSAAPAATVASTTTTPAATEPATTTAPEKVEAPAVASTPEPPKVETPAAAAPADTAAGSTS